MVKCTYRQTWLTFYMWLTFYTCGAVNSTYLEFDSSLLLDMNNNYITPVLGPSVLQAVNFSEDSVPPELVSFHLDMNSGLLHLTFSETIRVSALHPPSFAFQNSNVSSNISYRLMAGYSASPNGPEVTLMIPKLDLDNIKRFINLATEVNDTYLTIESSAVQDMNGNNVTVILESNALQAENFTEDITRPELSSFDLDLDANILWLTFDETVLVSSLNASWITLVGFANLTNLSSYHALETSSLLPNRSDDPVVPVLLSRFDSNEIKRLTSLATNDNNTFLILSSEAITDMQFNPVKDVIEPLPVSNFTEDTTRPELEGFVVDMDSRTFYLYFSETVNVSSIQVEEITLQSATVVIDEVVTLSPPTQPNGLDDPVIPISLSIFDTNNLTSLTHLYNSMNDSYLSVTNLTVVDMNGNTLVPISNTAAIKASSYIPDVTNASLLNFTVNLDTGTISLFFNETVAMEK